MTIAFTAGNKPYDGNTDAAIVTCDVVGAVEGDDVTCDSTSATATFDDKTAVDGKTVDGSGFVLTGADKDNYNLTNGDSASTTANIAPLEVTIAFTAGNKPYDGNTDAAIVTCDVVGAVEGDDVTCDSTSATATFDDKTAVDGKTVDGSGFVLTGADKDNYNLTNGDSASTTANITQRPLVVSATGVNKVYDGNAGATVTLSDDRVSGDVFHRQLRDGDVHPRQERRNRQGDQRQRHLDQRYRCRQLHLQYDRLDHGRHHPATLVVSATGVNKVYDGNAGATVTLSDDRVSGDVFTDSYGTATFTLGKNVGTGKAISVSGISISGTDAANYTFNTTASTTANITQRPLVVSATGVNKVYDGNAGATVTLSDDRVSGDVFTDSYGTATFTLGKNVGTGKAISVSGISISGTDAANYSLIRPPRPRRTSPSDPWSSAPRA